jgi:hypothetical protein
MSMSETTRVDPMIQMSVHSLPQAAQATQATAQRTRIGRLKMLLVWAVCAAPVVASYLSYYVIKPQGRVNYGSLILPPQGVPLDGSLKLVDTQGRAVLAASLKGQWLLVTVAKGACDASCEQHLYLQRQLREVLGKDKDRLDRVWLIPDQAQPREALLPGLKNAWVLHADASALQRWLAPEAGQPLDAHLYLVDPRGDWMMRFPVNADPARVKNESWDEAGR